MSWDYRVYKHTFKTKSGHEYSYYGVHEAYYENGSIPVRRSHECVKAEADSLEDLKWTLESMLKALEKPVLEYKDD